MATIFCKPGEPLEKSMKIFKRKVERDGIISDIKRLEHFEKPSLRKRKKSIAARKRKRKLEIYNGGEP